MKSKTTNSRKRMTKAKENLARIKRLLAPYQPKPRKKIVVTCNHWTTILDR